MKVLVFEWLLGNTRALPSEEAESVYSDWLTTEIGRWVLKVAILGSIEIDIVTNPSFNRSPHSCLKVTAEFSEEDAAWFAITWGLTVENYSRIKKIVCDDRDPIWC